MIARAARGKHEEERKKNSA